MGDGRQRHNVWNYISIYTTTTTKNLTEDDDDDDNDAYGKDVRMSGTRIRRFRLG